LPTIYFRKEASTSCTLQSNMQTQRLTCCGLQHSARFSGPATPRFGTPCASRACRAGRIFPAHRARPPWPSHNIPNQEPPSRMRTLPHVNCSKKLCRTLTRQPVQEYPSATKKLSATRRQLQKQAGMKKCKEMAQQLRFNTFHTGSPPLRGPSTFSGASGAPSPRMFLHLRSSKHCSKRATVVCSALRMQARGS